QHRDRITPGVALREVVALEDLRHGGGAREAEQTLGRHVEPFAVVADLRALRVEDLERLLAVGLGVAVELLAVELRARGRTSARIADAARVVPDDEDHLVAEILKLAQLLQHHGVSEVYIRRRRVDAELDAER